MQRLRTGAAAVRVSVIIPHLNQLDQARICLASLAAQDFPAEAVEILLVDNGSRVDLAPLQQAFPKVRMLTELKPGPGHARNTGAAAAKGELLLFIDADCRAHPGWITAAVAGLSQPGSKGVVGGDVRIDSAAPGAMPAVEAYESVFAYRQKMYIAQKQFSGTGNLGMRADVFRAVGPFGGIDLAEDLDWGQRAARAGHSAIYVADMIIWHPARKSFGELEKKWQRHIAHDLIAHRTAGGSGLSWALRAVAVAGSPVIDTVRVFVSDRLSGIGNRMRATLVLWRIRLWRAVEMLRQARASGPAASHGWNRD